MAKKRVRLNESALRKIIRECVMEAVSDIPAYITGRRKYYVDDYPEKSTVKAGNYDKEGYHTVITPDEWEYSHLSSDEGIFIVVANFYDYTYCFKKKEIERFDNSNEAKQYAIRMIQDKNFINDLIDDVYSEMDEGDETNVDDVNIEVYQDDIDERGNNVIFTTKGYRTLNKNR